MGLDWAVLKPLGPSWSSLGPSWGPLGRQGRGLSGPSWSRRAAFSRRPGSLRRPSWASLKLSWGRPGPPANSLWPLWADREGLLGRLVPTEAWKCGNPEINKTCRGTFDFNFFGPSSGSCWSRVGPSWGAPGAILKPSWAISIQPALGPLEDDKTFARQHVAFFDASTCQGGAVADSF